MKGKFIVFEALDAAGKSTQVDILSNRLLMNGIDVWKTKECTSGPIGKILRSEYLSGVQKCDEHVINILMAADRLEHVTAPGGILDHLSEDQWVICDRFVLSQFAYDNYNYRNISDLNQGFDYTFSMNKHSISKVVPDLTIFLEVPVEKCIERVSKRGTKPEVYEDQHKLELIRKTYDLAEIYMKQKNYNMNIVKVDGTENIDRVSSRIYDIVMQQFL